MLVWKDSIDVPIELVIGSNDRWLQYVALPHGFTVGVVGAMFRGHQDDIPATSEPGNLGCRRMSEAAGNDKP